MKYLHCYFQNIYDDIYVTIDSVISQSEISLTLIPFYVLKFGGNRFIFIEDIQVFIKVGKFG